MKAAKNVARGIAAFLCVLILIGCALLVWHEFSYSGVPYENLILTPAQYAQLPFAQIEATTTYAYILNDGGKSISFFGAYDTINPRDAELSAIQKAFEAEQPDLVLVEGLPQVNASSSAQIAASVKAMSFAQAVKEGGEDLYALKLAADAGVPFEPLEQASSSDLDDPYLFEQIESDLQNHDRLFVVYGSGHAVRLQPALEALFASFATST